MSALDMISRRSFNTMLLAAGAVAVTPPLICEDMQPEISPEIGHFLHPGMLHSRADLERMQQAVLRRTQPIFAGFELMRTHPLSQSTYISGGGYSEIGRNPTVHSQEFDRDSNAAYQCALMGCITGDLAYAKVAIGIMDAWSAVLHTISGADAVLCAGLGPFKMLNAAELMRHTKSGWPNEKAEQFGRTMRRVVLPVIENFAPFANGNWDTAAIKTMMAIAIYDDNRPLFERALTYYRFGCGDGRLSHYIFPSGQCQESGRDQQHTQLGLAHMGDCCEMAWHQGLDLYSSLDNRLLLGFEYTARYILGEEVSFKPDIDQTGKYRHESISPRSDLRPIYEQIYNHYVHRRGVAAPYTQRAAEKLRPEGAAFGADHTGFGTLLYTREDGSGTAEATSVAVPSGVHVVAVNGIVEIDFVPLARAERYTISRAEDGSAKYSVIARNVEGRRYSDQRGTPSHLYSYRVSSTRSNRTSLSATEMVGLPIGWLQSTLGQHIDGNASFDGAAYHLQASGTSTRSDGTAGVFIHCAMLASNTFTARIVPLIASQFVELGIAASIDRDSASPEAMLLISPRGETERPAWSATLLHPVHADASMKTLGTRAFAAPTIRYGRLVEPLWLRLRRDGTTLQASVSTDSSSWIEVGSAEVRTETLRVGLFLNSGIDQIMTEVCFDQVSLTTT